MAASDPNLTAGVNVTGPRVLVADDDAAIRLVMRHRLEADGCGVEEASDSYQALAALRTKRFDVALMDIIMPGVGGLEVLSTIRGEGIRTPIIVITAASTMTNAVEAIKRGAHDYLTKPFANLDLVALAVSRAVEAGTQTAELDRLKQEIGRQVGGEIVGRSPAMQEVYKLIGRIVTNDANVLICGESGTGKELVARAIHFKSDALAGAVCRGKLLRDSPGPAGKRTLRPRTRRVYGRDRAPRRKVRAGRQRHALPRRDR